MKKTILLSSALLIFACSSDDLEDSSDFFYLKFFKFVIKITL